MSWPEALVIMTAILCGTIMFAGVVDIIKTKIRKGTPSEPTVIHVGGSDNDLGGRYSA